MLNTLLDSLFEKHLILPENKTLLRSPNINSHQEIISLLRLDTDKQTIVALTDAIANSTFVKHDLDWTEVKPALIQLLASSDVSVRAAAVNALGNLEATEALEDLIKIAVSDEDIYLRGLRYMQLDIGAFPVLLHLSFQSHLIKTSLPTFVKMRLKRLEQVKQRNHSCRWWNYCMIKMWLFEMLPSLRYIICVIRLPYHTLNPY